LPCAEVVVQVNASSSCIERARLPSARRFFLLLCMHQSNYYYMLSDCVFAECATQCVIISDYHSPARHFLVHHTRIICTFLSLSLFISARRIDLLLSARASHYTTSLINALHNCRFFSISLSLATHSLLIAPFVLPSGQAPLFDFLRANTGSLNNL